MPTTDPRNEVLFLPVTRTPGMAHFTVPVKGHLQHAAQALEIDSIFPEDAKYTEGVICSDRDVRDYWRYWRTHIGDIKALVVCSGDFMAERAIQETVRLLPEDVPLFMILCNDDPKTMGSGNDGDSLCGSLSACHILRMIGREFTRVCRIDTRRSDCLEGFLREYMTIADGVHGCVSRNQCVRFQSYRLPGADAAPVARYAREQRVGLRAQLPGRAEGDRGHGHSPCRIHERAPRCAARGSAGIPGHQRGGHVSTGCGAGSDTSGIAVTR